MSIIERPGYEVACDHEGCIVRTSELGGEFAFWSDASQADQDWIDAGFYSGKRGHFCDDHAPRCETEGCNAPLTDDDQTVCEDCADGLPVTP